MAPHRRKQKAKIQRKALDNPDELVESMERDIDAVGASALDLIRKYSKAKSWEDRYYERLTITDNTYTVKQNTRALLELIQELQHKLRIATDEAIEANIFAARSGCYKYRTDIQKMKTMTAKLIKRARARHGQK